VQGIAPDRRHQTIRLRLIVFFEIDLHRLVDPYLIRLEWSVITFAFFSIRSR
jgi:hypothetical protein